MAGVRKPSRRGAYIVKSIDGDSRLPGRACEHNCIPVSKWFRQGWMCVRCDTWFRVHP